MNALALTMVNVTRELIEHLREGFQFLAWVMVAIWNAFTYVVDMIGVFVLDAILITFEMAVLIWVTIVRISFSVLPNMPENPVDNIALSSIGQANVYVPVVELVALMSAWSLIFACIGLYKLGKFIRGGG